MSGTASVLGAAARYKNTQVTTCSPAELVLMLLDGVIRFATEAEQAIIANDRARAGERIDRTHKIIEESQAFGVNILSEAQEEWGRRFAGKVPEGQDRFSGLDVITAVTGAPILPETLAWLDCRVSAGFDGGDHTIFLGEVLAVGAMSVGDPILYHNRQWRRLAPLE